MKLKSFLSLFFFVSPIFCAHMGIDEYRMGKFKEAAKLLMLDEMPNHDVNYYLGELNLYGYGLPRDEKKAIEYYQKSAEQDDLNAIQMMARYALLIEKNPSKALAWFKKPI